MKKARAKKHAAPKAVHTRPKRKAARPEVMPVEGPTNKEPPAPALEVVGNKARRRLDRPSGKRFAGGGGVIGKGSTPSLAEASELGWTVDNYPPRDLLKRGKIL